MTQNTEVITEAIVEHKSCCSDHKCISQVSQHCVYIFNRRGAGFMAYGVGTKSGKETIICVYVPTHFTVQIISQ